MPPLSFTDEEMATINAGARPLPPWQRPAFLQMVAAALRERPSPAGAVLQAVASAQRYFLTATVGPRRAP